MPMMKRTITYGKLLLGAWTGRWALSGPLYVQVGPSTTCNFSCLMCWDHGPAMVPSHIAPCHADARSALVGQPAGSSRKEGTVQHFFPMDRFSDLLTQLEEMGTRRIKFTGRGEPLLHPRWRDMIELVKRKGMRCTITTNGSLFEDYDAGLMVDLGVDELEISLNAATPQTHAHIANRDTTEGFEKILDWVKRLSAEKRRKRAEHPLTILSFVILKTNYTEIADLPGLARRVGFQRIALRRVSFPHAARSYMLDRQDMIRLQHILDLTGKRCVTLSLTHNCEEIFRWGPSLTHRSEEEQRLLQRTPCYVGWYFCQIQGDGTVYPCCQCNRPLGTLTDASFHSIWHGQSYQHFRTQIRTFHHDKQRSADTGCLCSECGFLRHNLSMDRILRWNTFRRTPTPSLWSLGDLKRF